MSLPILAVGSLALDTVETPFATREDLLGGAVSHFSAAASLFAPVRVVAAVGDDFPLHRLDFLRARGVDLTGVAVRPGSSFRWRGRYHLDMESRDTLDLQLGVFEDFRPELPPAYKDSPVLFLANVDPDLQLHVLDRASAARLTACDTIDHWIREKRAAVDRLFARCDMVFLNQEEARLYADTPSLRLAARRILERGCRVVVIKKGENGALVGRTVGAGVELFVAAAYPLEEVVDPTGAGDSFAGAVMGRIAADGDLELRGLRRAVVTGGAVASLAVERFGTEALESASLADVERREAEIRALVAVEPVPDRGVER